MRLPSEVDKPLRHRLYVYNLYNTLQTSLARQVILMTLLFPTSALTFLCI